MWIQEGRLHEAEYQHRFLNSLGCMTGNGIHHISVKMEVGIGIVSVNLLFEVTTEFEVRKKQGRVRMPQEEPRRGRLLVVVARRVQVEVVVTSHGGVGPLEWDRAVSSIVGFNQQGLINIESRTISIKQANKVAVRMTENTAAQKNVSVTLTKLN